MSRQGLLAITSDLLSWKRADFIFGRALKQEEWSFIKMILLLLLLYLILEGSFWHKLSTV